MGVSVGGITAVLVGGGGGVSLGMGVSVGTGVGGCDVSLYAPNSGWNGVGVGEVYVSGVIVGPIAVGGGGVSRLTQELNIRQHARSMEMSVRLAGMDGFMELDESGLGYPDNIRDGAIRVLRWDYLRSEGSFPF
jgi:hypothetical protein